MARGPDLAAALEHREGAADRAAIFLAAATTARKTLGHTRAPHERRAADQLAAVLRRELGAGRHAELERKAATFSLRESVELSLGGRVPAA